jgi:hypothetical protein
MTKERNKHIACLVLKGHTYESVGIQYGISRERVYQITKRVCKQFAPDLAHDFNIKKLRKDCDRLISKISESNDAG